MKSVRKILLTLAFATTVISCAGASVVTPSSKHPLGRLIQGTYTVSSGSEMIGHLNLGNGGYSFTVVEGIQIPPEANRLFFVKYPEGAYSVEYYGSVGPDTLLENLEHRAGRAVLTYIRFNSDRAGSLADTTAEAIRYLFVIISDKEEQGLYFASVAAEVQEWTVTKPWD